jgi:hypothetical protein
MERLTAWGDYKQKLKDAKPYYSGTLPEGIKFHYASPNDPDLVRLRQEFKLDSVAGAGDELSKIKNLLHWVHNIVPHDGNSDNPEVKNTIAMVELCKKVDAFLHSIGHALVRERVLGCIFKICRNGIISFWELNHNNPP